MSVYSDKYSFGIEWSTKRNIYRIGIFKHAMPTVFYHTIFGGHLFRFLRLGFQYHNLETYNRILNLSQLIKSDKE